MARRPRYHGFRQFLGPPPERVYSGSGRRLGGVSGMTCTDLTTRLGLIEADPGQADSVMPVVYEELRRIADHHFRGESPGHTLQPTAVVHEAYLRLVDQTRASVNDRRHFVAIAATAIRRVLVDHARTRGRIKRTPPGVRRPLEAVEEGARIGEIDMIAIDESLTTLESREPRMAKVVELRFFGGFTFEEIADHLSVSVITAKRDWAAARAWLERSLGDGDG